VPRSSSYEAQPPQSHPPPPAKPGRGTKRRAPTKSGDKGNAGGGGKYPSLAAYRTAAAANAGRGLGSGNVHDNPSLSRTRDGAVLIRRKSQWKNFPELEDFLVAHREEYLRLSTSMNYTPEQRRYNNELTEKLLDLAARCGYVFDERDFNFVAVRDRIRCYYKSYVQSSKKRGVSIVGHPVPPPPPPPTKQEGGAAEEGAGNKRARTEGGGSSTPPSASTGNTADGGSAGVSMGEGTRGIKGEGIQAGV